MKENESINSKIYVIDDDEPVRDSLQMLFESVGLSVVTFSNPYQFLEFYTEQCEGCIVLDIRMPSMSGLELQQKLNSIHCILPIIFITGHGDVPMAVQAIKDGAVNFIQKPFREQEILDLVNHALLLDNQQRIELSQHKNIILKINTLTGREQEVLKHMIQGKANKIIANEMSLSRRTVEIHRCRVMEKMGTKSLAHLVQQIMQVNSAQELKSFKIHED